MQMQIVNTAPRLSRQRSRTLLLDHPDALLPVHSGLGLELLLELLHGNRRRPRALKHRQCGISTTCHPTSRRGATHLLLVLSILPDAAPARKERHLAAVADGVQELQHVEPAKYHNHIR